MEKVYILMKATEDDEKVFDVFGTRENARKKLNECYEQVKELLSDEIYTVEVYSSKTDDTCRVENDNGNFFSFRIIEMEVK